MFKQPGTTTKLKAQKTYDYQEGWHNKLKKRVSVARSTIYKIIDEFKKEQAANEVKMEQISIMDTNEKRQRDIMKLTKD